VGPFLEAGIASFAGAGLRGRWTPPWAPLRDRVGVELRAAAVPGLVGGGYGLGLVTVDLARPAVRRRLAFASPSP
jgi:hypothetical protein